jgi:SulP family sulfate permease
LLYHIFPFLRWLPEIRRAKTLRADIVAGITLAMIIVPQSMAYAKLAGLPPVYGLYAAFLPPVVAALFGSSRQLATGPVAIASLISAATVQTVAPPGTQAYISYAILLALMVGVLRLGLGVLRLGMLVNLLSGPVVIGFTNAAALIIGTSQVHYIFGVEAQSGEYHFQTVGHVVMAALEGTHWPTVGMSFLTAALLILTRRWWPRLPRVMIAVIVTSCVAYFSGYAEANGQVVGEIPQGLPRLQIPVIDFEIMSRLFWGAITLTLIGLMEAMSIAKAIATRTKQRIDVNQELIGQGMANLVGSFFQSYAVSGSFSRSAVNHYSGALTGFSSVVMSAFVMLTLLFLTPLLYHLPLATLAMIIVSALANIVQVKPVVDAWRVNTKDGLIGIITFVCTLLLAPKLYLGIAIGVVLSLGIYIHRTMRPHVAYLSRHADGTLRDAQTHGLALDQRIAILRFDGRLYFGASSYFEDQVLEAVHRVPELRYLVIDAGGINRVDATGEQTLRQVIERLRAINIDVYFTRAKRQFTDALERTGTLDYIGRDHFFAWNQHALEHLWSLMEPTYKARCPLNMPTPEKKSDAWSI